MLIVTFSDKRTKYPDIFEIVGHIQNLIGHHEVVQLTVVNLHVSAIDTEYGTTRHQAAIGSDKFT